MKKLLKRLGATIAISLLNHYQPQIEQMEKEGLKKALLLLLAWLQQVLDILTDADPNDEAQLEAKAKEILAESPEKFLEWAKIAIEQKEMDEDKKALIMALITDILNEMKEGL